MHALELSSTALPLSHARTAFRRTIAAGAAWATPAIVAVTAVPVSAVSGARQPIDATYDTVASAALVSGGIMGLDLADAVPGVRGVVAANRPLSAARVAREVGSVDPRRLDTLGTVLSLKSAAPQMLTQIATAAADGTASASSGVAAPGRFATLDLLTVLTRCTPRPHDLVLSRFGTLSLEIGAVAAVAQMDARPEPASLARSYHLGGLHLVFTTDVLDSLDSNLVGEGIQINQSEGWGRIDLAALVGSLDNRDANTVLFLDGRTTRATLAARLASLLPSSGADELRTLLLDLFTHLFLERRVVLLVNAQNDPAANNPPRLHHVAAPGDWARLLPGQFDVAALRIGIRDAVRGGNLYLGRASVGPQRIRGGGAV